MWAIVLEKSRMCTLGVISLTRSYYTLWNWYCTDWYEHFIALTHVILTITRGIFIKGCAIKSSAWNCGQVMNYNNTELATSSLVWLAANKDWPWRGVLTRKRYTPCPYWHKNQENHTLTDTQLRWKPNQTFVWLSAVSDQPCPLGQSLP